MLHPEIRMRRLGAFTQLSLDGFFADGNGDMSWAHKHDPEWQEFAAGNAGGDSALAFGRVTYEMMASFWPTPAGRQANARVAEGMGKRPKYVFSRTLARADWENTQVVGGDLVAEVKRLKAQDGPDLVILGSGSIVSQLTAARLIDSYQLVWNPLVLGQGRPLFPDVRERVPLQLEQSRAFANGNVVSWYRLAS